jgi:transposase
MVVERSPFDGQGVCCFVRTDVNRGAVGEARSAVPAADPLCARRANADRQSALLRGHPVDVAVRRGVEGVAQGISFGEHLLAAAARVGRRGRLGRSMARAVGRVGPAGTLGLGGMFCGCDVHPGEKRGARIGKTKRGKGTKLVVVADGEGVPLGLCVESASPHESKLVEVTLDDVNVPRRDRRRSPRKVTRLIYDRAADSDPLRKRLAERGVELICPHRVNRTKPKLQDGRKLRRYRRRWKIERTFAWLQNYRRLAIRYERKPQIFQAFVHIACLLITLKRL